MLSPSKPFFVLPFPLMEEAFQKFSFLMARSILGILTVALVILLSLDRFLQYLFSLRLFPCQPQLFSLLASIKFGRVL